MITRKQNQRIFLVLISNVTQIIRWWFNGKNIFFTFFSTSNNLLKIFAFHMKGNWKLSDEFPFCMPSRHLKVK